jgi:hypothetical protein
VAEVNPNYDTTVEGSEPIIITHPELIASFDGTKVNHDIIEASKSKTNRGVRAGIDDGGECIVTESSSCATAVRGRLGKGEALLVYTVFGSGKTYHPDWATPIDSSLNDMNGHSICWRYASNDKGSLHKDGALDYFKTTRYIPHLALVHPEVMLMASKLL